jgi:hypothetical protein
MIVTITKKVNDKWEDVDAEFPTVDHAKRHALEETYAEYKIWQHEQLQAHLFYTKPVQDTSGNAEKIRVAVKLVSKEEEPKKAKKANKDVLEQLADEWDELEEDE